MVILLIGCVAAGYGVYLFNKKPVDVREHQPDFEISAAELVKEFSDHEEAASKKYIDRILIVRGQIKESDITSSTLFLNGSDPLASITCSFYPDEIDRLKRLNPGDTVYVKGKCTGKLIDIVMNNCSIINPR